MTDEERVYAHGTSDALEEALPTSEMPFVPRDVKPKTEDEVWAERMKSGTWLPREEYAKMHAEQRDTRNRLRGERSRLSMRFLAGELNFATFPIVNTYDITARDAVEQWIDAAMKAGFARPLDEPTLLIYGPVGVGKSGLAASAVRRALDVTQATFLTKVELIADVHAIFQSEGAGTEIEAMNRIAKIPILAIDDFDKGAFSASVNKILWYVIDYRYRFELPTIITTNKTIPELYELMAPGGEDTAHAILDRIDKTSLKVELIGHSKRGRREITGDV